MSEKKTLKEEQVEKVTGGIAMTSDEEFTVTNESIPYINGAGGEAGYKLTVDPDGLRINSVTSDMDKGDGRDLGPVGNHAKI